MQPPNTTLMAADYVRWVPIKFRIMLLIRLFHGEERGKYFQFGIHGMNPQRNRSIESRKHWSLPMTIGVEP